MATSRVRRLNSNHDMVFGHGARDFVGGTQSTAQRVRCELLTILGEWFQDLTVGIPWWQQEGSNIKPILGVARDLPYTEVIVKAKISSIEGIAAILDFQVFLSGQRGASIKTTVSSVDGDVITIELPVP